MTDQSQERSRLPVTNRGKRFSDYFRAGTTVYLELWSSIPTTPFMVRVYTRCPLRDAAQSYQQPLDNLRMVTPRAESSPSNCATPGEVSRSPGTMTAHSRFSRNSFDLSCHCPKDDAFASPIWTMDQCRTSASAAASSGNGPDSMKWLFPCTRIPTIRSQTSRRGSLHRATHRRRPSPMLEPGLCGCAFLSQSIGDYPMLLADLEIWHSESH